MGGSDPCRDGAGDKLMGIAEGVKLDRRELKRSTVLFVGSALPHQHDLNLDRPEVTSQLKVVILVQLGALIKIHLRLKIFPLPDLNHSSCCINQALRVVIWVDQAQCSVQVVECRRQIFFDQSRVTSSIIFSVFLWIYVDSRREVINRTIYVQVIQLDKPAIAVRLGYEPITRDGFRVNRGCLLIIVDGAR